jgi:hypothetical protein
VALVRQNWDLALKAIPLLSCKLGTHMNQIDPFTSKMARERPAPQCR